MVRAIWRANLGGGVVLLPGREGVMVIDPKRAVVPLLGWDYDQITPAGLQGVVIFIQRPISTWLYRKSSGTGPESLT